MKAQLGLLFVSLFSISMSEKVIGIQSKQNVNLPNINAKLLDTKSHR